MFVVHALLATEQERPGNLHIVEDHLGGVARSDAVLLELLTLTNDPSSFASAGTMKLAWPFVPSSGSTTATTT